jgi:thermolabile hemolysin
MPPRLIALISLLLVLSAAAGKVFTFGDSLSDTGNVFSISGGIYPPSPYFEGRFSNGKVWVEHLAAELGRPADSLARLDGGRNYAVGGSETTGTLSSQLTSFQLDLGFNTLGSDDLCILWIGGNDILNGTSAVPAEMITRVENFLNALSLRNARRFLLVNLPDLSKIPPEIGTPSAALTRARSIDYNTRLATLVAGINNQSGKSAVLIDVFSMFEEITARPQAYGFSTATESAYDRDTGALVSNPERFIFWDDRHPTAVTHRLIGQLAAQMYLKRTGFIPIHTGTFDGNLVASWILPWDLVSLQVEASSTLLVGSWGSSGLAEPTNGRFFSIARPLATGPNFFRLRR